MVKENTARAQGLRTTNLILAGSSGNDIATAGLYGLRAGESGDTRGICASDLRVPLFRTGSMDQRLRFVCQCCDLPATLGARTFPAPDSQPSRHALCDVGRGREWRTLAQFLEQIWDTQRPSSEA